jgi:hypothetical protein
MEKDSQCNSLHPPLSRGRDRKKTDTVLGKSKDKINSKSKQKVRGKTEVTPERYFHTPMTITVTGDESSDTLSSNTAQQHEDIPRSPNSYFKRKFRFFSNSRKRSIVTDSSLDHCEFCLPEFLLEHRGISQYDTSTWVVYILRAAEQCSLSVSKTLAEWWASAHTLIHCSSMISQKFLWSTLCFMINALPFEDLSIGLLMVLVEVTKYAPYCKHSREGIASLLFDLRLLYHYNCTSRKHMNNPPVWESICAATNVPLVYTPILILKEVTHQSVSLSENSKTSSSPSSSTSSCKETYV